MSNKMWLLLVDAYNGDLLVEGEIAEAEIEDECSCLFQVNKSRSDDTLET